MKHTTKQSHDTINILFCGTGGQGVLKAAEICGLAAMNEGFHVKKSEVHGMAQRGGSVESHLRFGKEVFSPLIPHGAADYLVPFHKDEHDRLSSFLKKGGTDLLPGLENASRHLEDMRYLNTWLLGVLSRCLPLKEESWIAAMEAALPAKYFQTNRAVFLTARHTK